MIEIVEKATSARFDNLEILAAAYLKATSIPPERVELVQETKDAKITWHFRERQEIGASEKKISQLQSQVADLQKQLAAHDEVAKRVVEVGGLPKPVYGESPLRPMYKEFPIEDTFSTNPAGGYIHYVHLNQPILLVICGIKSPFAILTTNESAVTCPRCREMLESRRKALQTAADKTRKIKPACGWRRFVYEVSASEFKEFVKAIQKGAVVAVKKLSDPDEDDNESEDDIHAPRPHGSDLGDPVAMIEPDQAVIDACQHAGARHDDPIQASIIAGELRVKVIGCTCKTLLHGHEAGCSLFGGR